ncbi:hypothetical protein D9758_001108 [Tetrapyrgos nigripes]|uniref:Threonylcarbamoyl-AMP synthase n=1 Tax=Tetrapyrgos nigripes TaxID=182062 RepID=A0A8H5LU23_9AGAR|nr:hypothetical protein D9758_001108 [Tetrapyrgos nigripes]
MSTQVLRSDPASISFSSSSHLEVSSPQTRHALEIAARHLTELHPVVFPTETVYGLGALALNPSAASQIFSVKGRPPDNPLIVHVSSHDMLRSMLPSNFTIPKSYRALMKHFWPGPLTLLFPSDPSIVPSIITAGQSTVGIRMPSHPVARALITLTNAPIAAPSANSSGKPSPTAAEHVVRDLGDKVPVILDGGPCGVGLESTVIDGLSSDNTIRVLRPGGVTVEDIERALKEEAENGDSIPRVLVHRRDFRDAQLEASPTTPGMKYRHYSPSVPVTLLMTLSSPPEGVSSINANSYLSSLQNSIAKVGSTLKIGLLFLSDSRLGRLALPESSRLQWHRYDMGPSADPSVAARRLFDGLLTLDAEGVDMILIEEVVEKDEGLAIMNRAQKAAGELQWISF